MVFSSSATSTTAAALSGASSTATTSTLLDPYLHRLPAIYTHPSLVHQHVTHLLSSHPHGSHLIPAMESLINNDGSSTPPVLLLRGTIPMQYKGVLYHLPIDLYLPPSYPCVCPTVYVRPVSSMCIKPNHKHVGLDGMVYLPYLAQWKAPTTTIISSTTKSSSLESSSNLKELVTWMSRLFGEEPPCFAKPRINSGGGSSSSGVGGGSGGGLWQQGNSTTATPPPSQPKTSSSQELLEREIIAEANRAAEAARRAEANEQHRRQLELERTERNNRLLREEQLLLHEAKLSSLKSKATEEIQASMKSLFADLGDEIRTELQYQKKLEHGQGQIEIVRNDYEKKCQKLKEGKRELNMAIDTLEGWLTAVEIISSSGQDPQQQQQPQVDATTTRADLMALPSDTPSAQMLSLSAESASIDDTIYFLDQALVRNTITLEIFMKEVRRLSRRQFMAKVGDRILGSHKAPSSRDSVCRLLLSFHFHFVY